MNGVRLAFYNFMDKSTLYAAIPIDTEAVQAMADAIEVCVADTKQSFARIEGMMEVEELIELACHLLNTLNDTDMDGYAAKLFAFIAQVIGGLDTPVPPPWLMHSCPSDVTRMWFEYA